MTYPKISIVTPSFNQGKYLEETILSILNQKYPNLEYIIIDGGSTDNSVEIIKKYKKHLAYWVSEKDNGQSDAINKGLQRVTGDLFNWINSDDYLEEKSLFRVAETYDTNPEKKIFCFGLYYLRGNKKELFRQKNIPADSMQCFCEPVISQPSTFFSTSAIRKTGSINALLHYSMDYELWLKFMFLFGSDCVVVHESPLATFRLHDETKTSKGDENFVNDMGNIIFSISEKAELAKYSSVLKKVVKIIKQYDFKIQKENIDETIAERLIIHFLLKWKRNIYSEKDFNDAKIILSEIKFNKINLSDKERQWLNEMKKNANPPSWLKFRAKRKIQSLISK